MGQDSVESITLLKHKFSVYVWRPFQVHTPRTTMGNSFLDAYTSFFNIVVVIQFVSFVDAYTRLYTKFSFISV